MHGVPRPFECEEPPVVQAIVAIHPEFDALGPERETGPVGWPRHFACVFVFSPQPFYPVDIGRRQIDLIDDGWSVGATGHSPPIRPGFYRGVSGNIRRPAPG